MPNSPAVPLQVDSTPKIKTDIGDTLSTTEESSPPKSRVELGKIHEKLDLRFKLSKMLTPPPPKQTNKQKPNFKQYC